jgi:transcriptional regulator with XRE-family HTH domain
MTGSPKPKKGSKEYIGAQIRTIRVLKSKTQAEAGAVLNVSWQQFAKYETGRNRITADAIWKLAKAWRCAPGDFFA